MHLVDSLPIPGVLVPASSAEEAAHAHARATVAVDLGTVFRNMTPEALARAMQLGNTEWRLSAYELTGQSTDGDDHLFDITYQTEIGPLPLRYRFRQIDGAWRVVDIEKPAT
jgi:hypothetical protein